MRGGTVETRGAGIVEARGTGGAIDGVFFIAIVLTGAGGTTLLGAGGGMLAFFSGTIGATEMPTMSSSSRFNVAARSRITLGPEEGAGGVEER